MFVFKLSGNQFKNYLHKQHAFLTFINHLFFFAKPNLSQKNIGIIFYNKNTRDDYSEIKIIFNF